MIDTHSKLFQQARKVLSELPVPTATREINTKPVPGLEGHLAVGRSKTQCHLIFTTVGDLRSNLLDVQNRLSRHKNFKLKKADGAEQIVSCSSLGVRDTAPHGDFLCAVIVKLEEVGLGTDPEVGPQDALLKVENHIQLLLANLASGESMTGLFGELFIVRSLLQAGYAPIDVVDWWKGPARSARDFEIPQAHRTVFLEVKTTTRPAFPRHHSINSLSQAVQVPGERLFLLSVGLTPTSDDDADATCIAALADEIAEALGGSPTALKAFKESLIGYGAPPNASSNYICFDLDWKPRPRWSLTRWNADPWALDLDPDAGVKVPTPDLFANLDVVPGSVSFELIVRQPVHPIVHPDNPRHWSIDVAKALIDSA